MRLKATLFTMAAARQEREANAAALLRAGEAMAAELEAGQSQVAALEAATDEWPPLAQVVRAHALGLDVPRSLAGLAEHPGAESARYLAAAWQVAQTQGNGLADALRTVVAELRRDQATARVVAGELASARATAWVVATLPLGVALMGRGMGADPFRFLLTQPVGWLAFALGIGLIWAGLRWIEAIAAPASASAHRDEEHHEAGMIPRFRLLWSALAGVGAWLFLGSVIGLAAGVAAGVVCWRVIARMEPAHLRREREQVVAELPFMVRLIAAGLRSGASVLGAVDGACDALPGPAAARLRRVTAQVRWGSDPIGQWQAVARDPQLAPLGKALLRSHRSGAPVGQVLAGLSADLAETARAEVESRARTVGVRAALPLGLCLMPAFIALGIVPLVGSVVARFGASGLAFH